jgi:hypothetical protein
VTLLRDEARREGEASLVRGDNAGPRRSGARDVATRARS